MVKIPQRGGLGVTGDGTDTNLSPPDKGGSGGGTLSGTRGQEGRQPESDTGRPYGRRAWC